MKSINMIAWAAAKFGGWFIGAAALITVCVQSPMCRGDEAPTTISPQPRSPNFVVFIADDLGTSDLGCYGGTIGDIATPTIDALAENGLRFDRAFLTCSSCSPSRCSILTSRYPHNTGAAELHLPLPADQTLVTDPLRAAGYHTMAIGKWHLGNAVKDRFDVVGGSKPEAMGDAWVKAIRDRPRDRPFFMWAAHSDPHRPYDSSTVGTPVDASAITTPPFLPDAPEVRADLADYGGEVQRFDAHVAMAIEELRRQDVMRDTVVIVMTDNGRPFPHCKTMVNAPGVRTPLVMHYPPMIHPGGVTDALVSSIDIAATVLELAGVDPPDSFQGSALGKVLRDPTRRHREAAFAEHNWHDYRAFERAVIGRRYLYVRNWMVDVPATPPADAVNSPTFDVMRSMHRSGTLPEPMREAFVTPRAAEFLFDLESDPHCIDNRVGDDELSVVLAEKRERLKQWQNATDDAFPGREALTIDGFDRNTGDRIIKKAHPSFSKNDAVKRGQPDSARPPNVVLVMADDVGIEGFGCYGGASYRTPNIDRMAARGVRFTHAYAQPLCAPTRVQLMTGLYNHRNWIGFGLMPPDAVTIGHRMRRAGYATGIFGKWQLYSYDPPDFPGAAERRNRGMHPSDAGFDRYHLYHADQTENKGSRYADPTITHGVGDALPRVVTHRDQYGPDLWTNELLAFLKQTADRPSFAYYPMALPHRPFQPTPRSMPRLMPRSAAGSSAAGSPATERSGANDRPKKPAGLKAVGYGDDDVAYAADMIEYVDVVMGRIIDGIERLGQTDQTVVIFYSDNGTHRDVVSQMRDGRSIVGGKGLTTQTGIHVPLVVQCPRHLCEIRNAETPVVRDDLVDASDFVATLLDIASVNRGGLNRESVQTDGHSFWPAVTGRGHSTRRAAFFWYDPRPGWDKDTFDRSVFALDQNHKYFSDGRLFRIGDPALDERMIDPQRWDAADRKAAERLGEVIRTTLPPTQPPEVDAYGRPVASP